MQGFGEKSGNARSEIAQRLARLAKQKGRCRLAVVKALPKHKYPIQLKAKSAQYCIYDSNTNSGSQKR